MYGLRFFVGSKSWFGGRFVEYRWWWLIVRELAGHSHFHNIKHRKAAVDSRRQTQFQKLSNDIRGAITVGGNDPSCNPRLARAIEVAKKAGMPNRRIENALCPSSAIDLTNIPTATYYGVLPHSVVVRVTALQARQRAIASELRSMFRRAGGDLEKGGWQFKDVHNVLLSLEKDRCEETEEGDTALMESLTLIAMDCDVVDIAEDGENILRLGCTSAAHCSFVEDALKREFPSLAQHLTRVHSVEPVALVTIEDETMRKSFDILMEKLDSHCDVVEIIHNARL